MTTTRNYKLPMNNPIHHRLATLQSSFRNALFALVSVTSLAVLAPTAEAGQIVHHGARATVVVQTPRVIPLPIVVGIPAPVVPHVVVYPPCRTYSQIYRVDLGSPRQILVPGHFNVRGRWVPAYWTWTY